jgi:hypothetical protein
VAGDTQPTVPLPEGLVPAGDAGTVRRRRGAWPWIIAFVIVAGLAVAAWFAAEAIARQLVSSVVRDQVRTQLSLPADQPIDVDMAGAVIPQLLAGSLDSPRKDHDRDVGRLWKTPEEPGGLESTRWGRPAPP